MNKFNLIFAFLMLPAFCMQEVPREILESEILSHTVINLIKRYINSNEPDCLKAFFENLNKLFIDKRTTKLLRKYFPERQNLDENYLPFTPLIVFATQTNNLELCKLILQHTEPQIEDLTIAIGFAVKNKNEDVRKLIIKQTKIDLFHTNYGTLLGTLDNDIVSVNNLLLQANWGHARFVKYQLLNGVNVNSASEHGETLLMAAIFLPEVLISARPAEQMINLLLYHPKIDVNAQTKSSYIFGCGWTALMLATLSGNKDLVLQLLNHGADITLKNQQNETAYDLAVNFKYPKIAELLYEDNSAFFHVSQCTIS